MSKLWAASRMFLLVLAISWMTPSIAAAQWEPYPWKNMPRTADGKVDMKAPPRRTADGKVDLSGFWMPGDSVRHLLNLATDLKPEEVPLQPWAAALYKERIDNNGKDHPGVRCLPSGIPEKNNIPDGLKVVQTPDVLVFLYESRTIYRQVIDEYGTHPERKALGPDGRPVTRWTRGLLSPRHVVVSGHLAVGKETTRLGENCTPDNREYTTGSGSEGKSATPSPCAANAA